MAGTGNSLLTFQGVPNLLTPGQNILPAENGVGNFIYTGTNGSVVGSGAFTLVVKQTNPGPAGSGGDIATLSGTLSADPIHSGSIDVTFSTPTSWTISGVLYSLVLQPGNVFAIGTSLTTLEANMTAVTPEPSFYALTGVGFAGLLGMAIRRKRQAA